MSFDIIGDVHGHATRLEALLQHLGYREVGGAWRHPSRSAVFVGDLIDGKGVEQVRTLQIVRTMVDAGSAQAVLGNHELNAIGWASRDPADDGSWLRPHTHKNRGQHERFLNEVVEQSALHQEWVDWMLTIPAWLERSDLRVVHACWSPADAEVARQSLDEDLRLSPPGLQRVFQTGGEAFEAFETLLKGPEVDLPTGVSFIDSYGHARTSMRLAWWKHDATTLRDGYWGPPGVDVPEEPLRPSSRVPEPDRPVLFGHYWFPPTAIPSPASRLAACVDYSAGNGGPLVAYRFDGEPELSATGFAWV